MLNFLINITFFLIIALILYVIHEIFKKYYKYRHIREELPTIYGLPISGILHKFAPIQEILYVIGSYFYSLNSWSYLTWFANVPLILTIDTQIIKHILNSDEFLNKADIIYKVMDKALPNGIITSKYFKWRHNRKLMNPTFSPHILQHFIINFDKCAGNISKYFETLSDGKEHDIFAQLKHEILQMAVETTMGPVLDVGENVAENMANNFNKLLAKLIGGIRLSFAHLDFLARTPEYYKILEELKIYMQNLIKRKLLIQRSKEEDIHFLDRAIKYQQQGVFDLEDTITETYTMIIGSFETVSTTLYSIIIMLAMHEEVQQKLCQEITEVLKESEAIELKHLEHLTYLNMVIEETLRLMPPIPIIGRETSESCHLTDKLKLPPNFPILISIFHLHRRPDLWGADAELFKPERFSIENIEKRHPYAYIPFSKGVRNCIGWRYALNALKILMANLLREFQFSTTFPFKDLIFVNQLSIRFLKEPKIQITKRHRKL